jgi:hypothetical protein
MYSEKTIGPSPAEKPDVSANAEMFSQSSHLLFVNHEKRGIKTASRIAISCQRMTCVRTVDPGEAARPGGGSQGPVLARGATPVSNGADWPQLAGGKQFDAYSG